MPHSITTEMVNSNPEGTRQRYRQYLEECVKQNHFNKVWVYYLLSTWYYAEGSLEKTIALCLRAILEHPVDPRAYYCLGTIYYGIFMNCLPDSTKYSTEAVLARPDFNQWPKEIQELVRQNHEFEKQNQLSIKAIRESKLAPTPEGAAKLALEYFGMTLKCNISNKDKQIVQTHINPILCTTRIK